MWQQVHTFAWSLFRILRVSLSLARLPHPLHHFLSICFLSICFIYFISCPSLSFIPHAQNCSLTCHSIVHCRKIWLLTQRKTFLKQQALAFRTTNPVLLSTVGFLSCLFQTSPNPRTLARMNPTNRRDGPGCTANVDNHDSSCRAHAFPARVS